MPKLFIVRGCIVQPDRSPVVEATVKAWDKALRREHLLGETTTDAAGQYVIPYTSDQLSRPDKTNADLLVRVYDQAGEEIAASPLILAASVEQVVELVAGNEPYRGPSEYDQLRAQVEPLLDEVEAAQLTEEDVAYLAGKTGLDPVHIAYFAKSAQLEQETGIPSPVFYGLFRQNLATSLPALIA